MPLETHSFDDPEMIVKTYEKNFVLVRPMATLLGAANEMPIELRALIARVCGAACMH